MMVQESCLHTASQLCAEGWLASEVPQVVVDQANCIEQTQEAQLSHRDRAMLRITKYFAKSLKVIQGHSK